MTPASVTESTPGIEASASAVRSFLFGNFVVAMGVIAVPGMIAEIAASFGVSLPVAGRLIGIGGAVLCVGAPLGAALTSRFDRRSLLVGSLAAYCVGHLACALAPGFASLTAIRSLAVASAAVFTPQAAATIGLMVRDSQRAAAVTTIFFGWSIASVLAMPIANLLAVRFGWQAPFLLIAALTLSATVWVARTVPRGLKVAPLSLAAWRSVLGHARLMTVLAVTLLTSAAQFHVLAYIAPLLRDLTGQAGVTLAALMGLYGVFGVLGNAWVSRSVGRLGADRTATLSVVAMVIGLVALGASALGDAFAWAAMLAGIAATGMGSFACNSSQQARLVGIAPTLASASVALNSSSLYAGQAIGALLGGLVIGVAGLRALPWVGAVLMVAALALSIVAGRLRR